MDTLNGQVSNTFTLLWYVADIACTLHTATYCVYCICTLSHNQPTSTRTCTAFVSLESETVAAGSVEVQARSQLRLCPHLHDIVDLQYTPLPLPNVQYSRLRHCPPLRINHPLFPETADTQQALC